MIGSIVSSSCLTTFFFGIALAGDGFAAGGATFLVDFAATAADAAAALERVVLAGTGGGVGVEDVDAFEVAALLRDAARVVGILLSAMMAEGHED